MRWPAGTISLGWLVPEGMRIIRCEITDRVDVRFPR
jgi:hypothetical protein